MIEAGSRSCTHVATTCSTHPALTADVPLTCSLLPAPSSLAAAFLSLCCYFFAPACTFESLQGQGQEWKPHTACMAVVASCTCSSFLSPLHPSSMWSDCLLLSQQLICYLLPVCCICLSVCCPMCTNLPFPSWQPHLAGCQSLHHCQDPLILHTTGWTDTMAV